MRRRTLLRSVGLLGGLGIAGCVGAPASEGPTEPTRTATTGATSPTKGAPPAPKSSPAGTPTAEPTPTIPTDVTDSPTGGGDPTATRSPTAAATPSAAQTVAVGAGGSLRFSPTDFEVGVGETVRWVWEAGGHNVRPSATPDGADWSGTPGEEFETFPADYTYEASFSVAGRYDYYCAPHRSAGMVGSFSVV